MKKYKDQVSLLDVHIKFFFVAQYSDYSDKVDISPFFSTFHGDVIVINSSMCEMTFILSFLF